MLDREGDTHLYLQISEIVRSRIVADGLSPGDPVISEAGIQREFGVARTTARRALQILKEQGLIRRHQGKGTFVRGPGEADPLQREIPLYQQIASEVRQRIQSGELTPSQLVPSETTLLRQYGAARETVRRAIALLRRQGWIHTIPHRGSYVSSQEQWPEGLTTRNRRHTTSDEPSTDAPWRVQ
ncbi:MAG TPA: GntR family transcriptional regulator [Nonomuraea sp.]|nr:GntR family transcriptional regulator [Nonomuraea sp.]